MIDEYQRVEGYRIPADADIPGPPVSDFWDRLKTNGESWWYLKANGVFEVARQVCEDAPVVETEVFDRGTDDEGIPYVAVKADVTVGGVYMTAIGSTDAHTNGLDDMVSTAETRAIRRALCRLLGIWRYGDADGSDAGGAAASAPDDFDPDPGHALSDEDAGSSEPAPVGSDDGDGDDW